MIFLLNRERILMEMLELAKLKISGKLKIPESEIVAGVTLTKDNKLAPEFKINSAIEANDKIYAEVITNEWGVLRGELEARLAGLESNRYGR